MATMTAAEDDECETGEAANDYSARDEWDRRASTLFYSSTLNDTTAHTSSTSTSNNINESMTRSNSPPACQDKSN